MIVPDNAPARTELTPASRAHFRMTTDGHGQATLLLPPSGPVVEQVERKLGAVTDRERSLLEVVAYADELGPAELAAVTTPAVATSLERKQLLGRRQDGRRTQLGFTHPQHRNVVLAGLRRTRAAPIARSLAEAVEATGAQRQDDALRIASWRLVSGDGRPEVLLAGAVAAGKRHDYPLAERLARAALRARPHFDAALLAAQLASWQGRNDQAERELAQLAAEAENDTQRGLVALARIDNSVIWRGTDEHGVLDEAEAAIGDPRWREQLAARRSGLVLYHRGPRAAVEATAPILQQEPGSAFAFACVMGAYSLGRLGKLGAAIEVTTRGHAAHLAQPSLLGGRGWWHIVMHCLALTYAGELDRADALATDHYRAALSARSTGAQAIFAVVPATAVGERGQVRTAIRRTREAMALCEQRGRPLVSRFCYLYGALALALAGRAHEATDALAALDALDLPDMLHDQVDLLQARAWTAAAAGHLPQARHILEEAAQVGADIGDLVGRSAALHGLARLGRAKQIREQLAATAEQVEGELAPARLDHTEALADDDAPGLEKVSRSFEAMGADLLAAEAAADAAVAHRHAGELHEAEAAQHRAEELAQRCDGAHTPALRAIDLRGLLPPAQWETVLMAATTGEPSKQIAAELDVSRRTVENRLQRAYDTLGISSRAELTQALG